MEATQGSPRYAPDGRGGDGPPQWRWLAMVLAVAVHGPIVLLLSSSGEGEGRRPREELERMRISWSERPRPAEPVPQADAPPTSTAARVPARIEAPHMPAADGELRGIPFVADDDLQAPAPAGAPEHGFRRDLLGPATREYPATPGHLPKLRMRDTSLAGRWHEQARRIDCGELAAALRAGSATLVGGGHDPGAARPKGGEASSETLLESMKRRGCNR
jgi:hypothetical protein